MTDEPWTKNKTGRAGSLYQFWGDILAKSLVEELKAQGGDTILNLASQEYFRSVDLGVLKARVIECVFEEWKPGGYKVVSFFAKKARGLMARFATDNRIDKLQLRIGQHGKGAAFRCRSCGSTDIEAVALADAD